MLRYALAYRFGLTPWERYGRAASASIGALLDREGAERSRPLGRAIDPGCGRGQYTLGDAGGDAGDGAPAVQFEVELAFGDVVDRLDELADRGEQPLAGTGRAIAVGAAARRHSSA